jgi:hypothetical protein
VVGFKIFAEEEGFEEEEASVFVGSGRSKY